MSLYRKHVHQQLGIVVNGLLIEVEATETSINLLVLIRLPLFLGSFIQWFGEVGSVDQALFNMR